VDGRTFIEFGLPVIGLLLGILGILLGLRAARRQRLVDDLPTSKTSGVFIGLVEVKGTAESERPLQSYLAGLPCVHYAWGVDERWSRTVTETYTDSEGHTQTRMRQESGWTTVANGGETQMFYLQDDCGVVLIRPEGAKIEPATIFERTCGAFDPLYYGKGPAGAVANSDGVRRFHEVAISLHQQLFLVGQARERQDLVAAEIAADKSAPMFLISVRSEKQISRGFGGAFWGWEIAGLLFCVAGFFAHDAALGLDPGRRWWIYSAAAAGYLAVYTLGWVGMVYNSMIDLRQRMRQGWSQVDVQLRRRHDLIPNLVNLVQGYRDYEKNLQTELAALRSESAATPPGVSGPDYRAMTQTVALIAERYPELNANETFGRLRENLVDTEQRIALARGYFNEIATFYNTRLEQVPDRYVAALARMKIQPLMEANEFERAPVKVELDKTDQGAKPSVQASVSA